MNEARDFEVPVVSIQPMAREIRVSRGENTTIIEVMVDGRKCVGKKIRDRLRTRRTPEWISSRERGLRQECWLLRQLIHPSIVMAAGLSFDDSVNHARPTLVMEYMEGGNLDDFIGRKRGHGGIDGLLQHAVLLDVARGLQYMHSRAGPLGPVVHWALCSRKVLLTFQQHEIPVLAKIGGFGAASVESRRPYHMFANEANRDGLNESTIATYAPEIFTGLVPHNATSVDIFSFGVLILHTVTQENPLPLPLASDLGYNLSEIERRMQHLDLLDDDHPLKQTVVDCLSNEPQYRPTAEYILSTIERAELRTLIPVGEVHSLVQAHERQLFRIHSEREQFQIERDRLIQQRDETDTLIRELEQRTEEQQQQITDLVREKEQLGQQLRRVSEQRDTQIRELQQVEELQQQNFNADQLGEVRHFIVRRPPRIRTQSLPAVIPSIGASVCREVNISRSDVQVLEEIDRGAWATVAKGRYRQCVIAVKWPHDQLLRDYPTIIPRLVREISIMAQLRHPNLVHFIGAVMDSDAQSLRERPLLLTELLDTNLRREYTRCHTENIVFGKHVLQSIFLDVAYGLHCLHTHNGPIIHRDLSAPNVLLKRLPNAHGCSCWLAKVSDFGSANLVQYAHTPGEGAILYSAPEVFPQTDPSREQPIQTTKLDVYSYGVLLCEVIAAELPTTNRYQSMLKVVGEKWIAMRDLIVQCTQTSATARPTAAEIIDELNRIPRPPLRTLSHETSEHGHAH